LRLLLDENFPLRLRHLLVERGIDCDHVITLGLRGATDHDLLALVSGQELILLTQDGDFEGMSPNAGQVVISRLWQGLPIQTCCFVSVRRRRSSRSRPRESCGL
jgi:predicted nuclease of predicted toxin-antitoxin system